MTAQVHDTSFVGPDVELDSDVAVGPFCVLEGPIRLGRGVKLLSHVSIRGRVTIGEETVVHPFSALGHPPQDLKYKGGDTELVIGARNTLREQVSMHLGTEVGRGRTVLGDDGYLMVGSHIGHDSIVGDGVVFANQATLGGHAVVGDQVIMGGLSAIHQFCRVGRHAFVGAGAIVTGNLIPYGMVDNHGHLAGLNLVGLKRRGFPRDLIHDLRTAYRLLFAAEGAFAERVDDTDRLFAQRPEIQEIIAFVREPSSRPLCTPTGR